MKRTYQPSKFAVLEISVPLNVWQQNMSAPFQNAEEEKEDTA